jgi:SAM-dependent methyltransferase
MSLKDQWERVYVSTDVTSVSWFQEHCHTSRRLISSAQLPAEACLIDVGGGASTLVDGLCADGFTNITVLDLSAAALDCARARLGQPAPAVKWLQGDITEIELPQRRFDLWHDRAAFHFLTTPQAQAAYLARMSASLKGNGHVVIATFGLEGPVRCSGLPVCRYDANGLSQVLGDTFELQETVLEMHRTPAGAQQQFVYCLFRFSGLL